MAGSEILPGSEPVAVRLAFQADDAFCPHRPGLAVLSVQLPVADHDIVNPVAWNPLPVTVPLTIKATVSMHLALLQLKACSVNGLQSLITKVKPENANIVWGTDRIVKSNAVPTPLETRSPDALDTLAPLCRPKSFRLLTIDIGTSSAMELLWKNPVVDAEPTTKAARASGAHTVAAAMVLDIASCFKFMNFPGAMGCDAINSNTSAEPILLLLMESKESTNKSSTVT